MIIIDKLYNGESLSPSQLINNADDKEKMDTVIK